MNKQERWWRLFCSVVAGGEACVSESTDGIKAKWALDETNDLFEAGEEQYLQIARENGSGA